MSLGWSAPGPRPVNPVPPALGSGVHKPQIDAQCALMVRAFCALIDEHLAAPHPLLGSQHLLRKITASGLGLVTADAGQMSLVLLNIAAHFDDGTLTPSCTGLLRNWQTAAHERLAAGVRA